MLYNCDSNAKFDLWGFAVLIAQKCINGVYHGVKTSELDSLAAETAAYLTTEYPDYSILAARIAVSNLHKQTLKVAFWQNILLNIILIIVMLCSGILRSNDIAA
jgi:hypothetical protein